MVTGALGVTAPTAPRPPSPDILTHDHGPSPSTCVVTTTKRGSEPNFAIKSVAAKDMIRPGDIAEAVRMLLRLSPACVVPEVIFEPPGTPTALPVTL